MVAPRTLVKIAAIGGLVVGSSGLIMQSNIIERVKRNDYYRNALKVLRAHPGAITILGEPIKDLNFKLTNKEDNFCDGQKARFKIPVIGAKERGSFYFWAEKEESEWILKRAEVELKKDPTRRLIIVKEVTSSPSGDEDKNN